MDSLTQLRAAVDGALYVAIPSADGKAARAWRWDADRSVLALLGPSKARAWADRPAPEGHVAWLGEDPVAPKSLRGVRALAVERDEALERALRPALLEYPNECLPELSPAQQELLIAMAEASDAPLYVALELRGVGLLLWRWHGEDRSLRMVRI